MIPPVKVGNLLYFFKCWKALDKGYNFSSNLTSIGGLQTKLWASKLARFSI
jgi:hypothetical protein